MSSKKVLFVIGTSFLIMIMLLVVVYDFDLNYLSLSNVLFIMGLVYFFPGLIIVTGAIEIFNGVNYLTSRTFSGLFNFSSNSKSKRKNTKVEGNYFKSYGDYLKFKKIHSGTNKVNKQGFLLLVVGVLYVVGSLVVGSLS